jgi:hypothetical protein
MLIFDDGSDMFLWGCGWRRRLPAKEGSCEYIEQTVVDSRQVVVLQLGV